jgi:hypothetical protein
LYAIDVCDLFWYVFAYRLRLLVKNLTSLF